MRYLLPKRVHEITPVTRRKKRKTFLNHYSVFCVGRFSNTAAVRHTTHVVLFFNSPYSGEFRSECGSEPISDAILKKQYSVKTSDNRGRTTLRPLPDIKGVAKDNRRAQFHFK